MKDNKEIFEKSSFKKIIVSNASIIFFIPITAYILSYGYNWGYNSHFSVPAYLTSYSFTPVLTNYDTLSYVFLGIIFFGLFLNFINHILKSSKNPFLNKLPEKILNILFFVIIGVLIYSIITKLIVGIILCITTTIIILYLYLITNSILKLHNNDSSKDEIKELNNNIDDFINKTLIPFLNSFGVISLIISILLSLFVSMFALGLYNASHQKYFYVTGQDNLVVTTYNDSYITVPLYEKNSSNYFKNIYTLTKMNETSIRLYYIPNLKPGP